MHKELNIAERNGKSRYADWRPNLYHQIKWASSLVAVPNDLPLSPAGNQVNKNKATIRTFDEKAKAQVRSFTSLQMFHTHAPLPRGFPWKSPMTKMLLSVP